ncbi:hypothetical protein Anas_07758 [Armadillidium nasatum]|uniref:Uncharacterized protein n=1 Tax=Armadillidium nasatum TaxID=96803 RepID=A0A5N5TL17_9CRUS|nr:hypothetical protein Anas_07758 [Armadillidium nasatum]
MQLIHVVSFRTKSQVVKMSDSNESPARDDFYPDWRDSVPDCQTTTLSSQKEREKDYKALYQQEFERRTTLMKLAQKDWVVTFTLVYFLECTVQLHNVKNFFVCVNIKFKIVYSICGMFLKVPKKPEFMYQQFTESQNGKINWELISSSEDFISQEFDLYKYVDSDKYNKEHGNDIIIKKIIQKYLEITQLITNSFPTRDYDELKHRFAESNKMVEVLRAELEEKNHQLNNLRNIN